MEREPHAVYMLQTGLALKTKEDFCCVPGSQAASNLQTLYFYDSFASLILFDAGTSDLCTPDEPIWWSWVIQRKFPRFS